MDESKKERKLIKGELNFKIHPMLAIKRDLKYNKLLKYPLSENDVCYPEFQSNPESINDWNPDSNFH